MNESQPSVRYLLDARRSRFTVQAFATGLLSRFGHNPVLAIRDFSGQVEIPPGDIEAASLRLIVNAASLVVIDDVKESDRREIEQTAREASLEADRYPEIYFESTQVSASRVAEGRYRARISGNLSLHGVTRRGVWIPARVTIGDEELRAEGDFTIRQSDYRIKPVRVAAGALKLKDELSLVFNIVARRE